MRSYKSVGVLALVLAALGAYIYFVERKKPSGPEAEARPKVFDVEADKIVEVMVRSGADRTVVRKVDGEWRVVEPIGFVMERRMLLGIKERAERASRVKAG